MFKYKYQRACNMGLSNSGNFVSMRTGSKLIETLSNSLYSNVYYVFDELVSNAYDADATIVEIQIADDKITIKDNGDAMDRSGVENFFDLGFIVLIFRHPCDFPPKLLFLRDIHIFVKMKFNMHFVFLNSKNIFEPLYKKLNDLRISICEPDPRSIFLIPFA